MFPPFPQEKAAEILEKLIESLDNGSILLEQTARPSTERKDQPVMLGALVCKDADGREVSIVTSSGNAKKLKACNDSQFQFADSIVSSKEIEDALAENDGKIHELTFIIDSGQREENELQLLRKERLELCSRSLEKVHSLYQFHCIGGKIRSLKEICRVFNKGKLPPTGTGDCCAPKLLDYAFSHGFSPISMAEVPYPPSGKSKSTLSYLPLATPCDERCGIILPAMLGLKILYQDNSICVVNKQSGLLSVPGRGLKKADSVETRFRMLFGDKVEIRQPAVHRLDMETSGLMILAFTKDAHRNLNRQFEEKRVHKEYIALLDGILQKKGIAPQGQMELFFRLDIDNRPHQIWDAEKGKSAITQWEILDVERYKAPDGSVRNATRVLFTPHTGRTHQLRLASADSHGFGIPIIGDTLYGTCAEGERLMLHARKISFFHPVSGKEITFECEPDF